MWRGEHSVIGYLYLIKAALHYVDESKFRFKDSRYVDATRDTVQRHYMRMPCCVLCSLHQLSSHPIIASASQSMETHLGMYECRMAIPWVVSSLSALMTSSLSPVINGHNDAASYAQAAAQTTLFRKVAF